MKNELVDLHEIERYYEYTRSNEIKYVAEIQHYGLSTFRVIKDMNSNILDMKIIDQFNKWDTQWTKIEEKNKNLEEKEISLNLAEERTIDAQNLQEEIDEILISAIENGDTIDWEILKENKKFNTPNPKIELNNELNKIKTPSRPLLKRTPHKPVLAYFQPKLSIVDKLFKSLTERKLNQANEHYESEMAIWKKENAEIEKRNKDIEDEYQELLINSENQRKEIVSKFDKLEQEWKNNEVAYYKAQNQNNIEVEKLESLYYEHNPESVITFCELVLNNSKYPDFIQIDFDIDYFKESKLIIVEFVLPIPEKYPTLTQVKYIATKKELKEYHLSSTQVANKYDTLIYNISLRTIYELFEADHAQVIDIIVFNGWVNAVNKAIGKNENNCIVSIQVKKEELYEIDLTQIDPKACFKNLKGVGSSKLSGITAIQPIINLNRNDKRFVSSYDVTDNLDESTNLAAMDWEDFEHLIREIFEKEFNSNGGEVKVTQASRDGGVDAIAFDPDPIRGGKIVIQAKRYTNTVGVSAVRDLYGTVMNEGATKGILVTTSDYGSDSYEFAKGKPITLLNGANLLYLLEKYGQKARIDIVEAKRLQKGI